MLLYIYKVKVKVSPGKLKTKTKTFAQLEVKSGLLQYFIPIHPGKRIRLWYFLTQTLSAKKEYKSNGQKCNCKTRRSSSNKDSTKVQSNNSNKYILYGWDSRSVVEIVLCVHLKHRVRLDVAGAREDEPCTLLLCREERTIRIVHLAGDHLGCTRWAAPCTPRAFVWALWGRVTS